MSDTDAGFVFSESATKRTAAAVRVVEGRSTDLTAQTTDRQLNAGDEVWVKIIGEAGNGGHYVAQIMKRPTDDINADSAAAATDFGTPHSPKRGSVYASNAPEIGTTTHALKSGRVCRGTIMRRQADQTIWVGIESYDFEDCLT